MSFIGTQISLNGMEMLPFKGTMKGVFVTVIANSTWDTILKSRRFLSLLGVFTKLRKATITFVMSARPSVRLPRLSVHPPVRLHKTTGLPLYGFS